MAVLDLGKLPESQTKPTTEQPKGKVLDLGIEEMPTTEQAPTPDDFILGDSPASALYGLTPEEAAELPEMGYLENKLMLSGELGKSFKLALGNLASSTPAQQIEVIQNVLPDAKVNTFESGETVVNYNGERFILNRPGVSATDVTRFAGQFLSFLPVGKASQIGKEGVKRAGAMQLLRPLATSASKQRLGQVAAAASASAGISAGLDVAASGLAGEESTQGVSKERAALSAIFGGGGELLGPAFRGIMSKFRGTPDDLKYINLDEVALLKEAEKRTGINLFEPQATQARADSVYMRILQELPETQQQMAVKLSRQNEEAAAAVTNYLAKIGDVNAAVNAPSQVKQVALNAVDAMKEARSNLVKQGYQEAFAAGTQVPVMTPLSAIDDLLSKTSSSASNPVRKTLLQAKEMLEADAVDGVVDLQKLHSVKMIMDDTINDFGLTGPSGQSRAALTEIKNSMVGEMDRASPLYDQVKTIYKEASSPINKVENSLIGKIGNIKDDNLKRVLPTIFDASESNPAVMKQAKSIIESQNPEAWQQLTRAYLHSQLGKLSTRAIEGVPNSPAMYVGALFGKNEIQRSMIMSALNAEQRGNAKWLEMALKAAARGRKQGSDTAGKTAA
jgi:hypothetical protein